MYCIELRVLLIRYVLSLYYTVVHSISRSDCFADFHGRFTGAYKRIRVVPVVQRILY